MVGENLTGECLQHCLGSAPGVRRKLRFAAGFAQELLGREIVFDGDLGEKQAALLATRDEQAVAANFDLFQTNRERRRKQGDFDLDSGQVV